MTFSRREWGLAALAVSAAVSGACSSRSDADSEAAGQPSGEPGEGPGGVLENAIVLDLHCDTPSLFHNDVYDLAERHDFAQVDIPRMREGGVTGVFFSVYTSARREPAAAEEDAREIIDEIRQAVAQHPSDLMLATTADDAVAAKKQAKIAIYMGVEGGHMINSSLDTLRDLHGRGARYMTLTHTANTPWAGSSGSDENKGLSDLGREIVREMNRIGMIVDISHVSDQTFQDVIETTSAPVIASHSSCRALANHPRNMTDEMIEALAKNGGVIHINYYNAFIDDEYRARKEAMPNDDAQRDEIRKQFAGDPVRRREELRKLRAEFIAKVGRSTLSRLLDHFEHAVKVAGVDHVGLGSDFDGVSDELPEGIEDVSKMPNLVSGLQERGFSDDDVLKILGGNTLRVMRAVEAAAQVSG